jgi:hypothetical protein
MGAHSQSPSEARHERGKPKAVPLEEIAIVKRLIDQECAPGSQEGLLVDLVRATPPFEPAPFKRTRVSALVRDSARRTRGFRVRVGATVLLLGGAAAAAAAVEHSEIGFRNQSPIPLAVVPAPVVPAVAPLAATSSGVQAAPPVAVASTDSPSTRLKSVARPVSAPFKDGEDPAPVLEAIRALRSEDDAARASVLLAEYLKAHPRSVLSEDALALSIESAIARHDGRAASEFSRRYLAQFPGGRYRAFALRAAAP